MNKILSEDSIVIIGQQKMENIIKSFPTIDRTLLMRFHIEMCNIESWMSEQMTRLKKKK